MNTLTFPISLWFYKNKKETKVSEFKFDFITTLPIQNDYVLDPLTTRDECPFFTQQKKE